MDDALEKIKKQIEKLALQAISLEPDDIPAMGGLLNMLSSVQTIAETLDNTSMLTLIKGLRQYIEKLVLKEKTELTPVEEAISVLQDICQCMLNDEPYPLNIFPVLEKLDVSPDDSIQPEQTIINGEASSEADQEQHLNDMKEDLDTYRDFVLETLENLGKIEIHLIDLEQFPQNPDTIHVLFRAFHTIKGVSGFLNLKKINRISHSVENLLDGAREGEFKINDTIIDIILEAVDGLKQLINCVELAMAIGDPNLEGDIDLEPLIDKLDETLRVSKQQNKRIGDLLVETGAIAEKDLENVLEKQKSDPGKKLGAILVDEKMVKSKDVIKALRDQKKGVRIGNFQVKVDTEKLDNLVDLTGELVISQSMLRQSSRMMAFDDHQFNQNLSRLAQIVSSLQKTATSMRMVTINSIFQKMVRLVRDLAKDSGKDVRLEMFGEETEIDRNLVEELYEPLVHMIRNAVDHGIEPVEERRRNGKPAKGTIRLGACQRGGHIIIEIQDDGRGMNAAQILQKAVTMGLIDKGANLSDAEIFDLVFHPGLSTAKRISDISGRGVGMDIVRKRIEKLRGRVELQSKPGEGCTVSISLPLTLAIIDGMVVRAGSECYIIPTLTIVESFQPKREDYHTVQGKGELVRARGNLIPLIRLDMIFGMGKAKKNPWEGLVVVVENNGKKAGLLLDELLRQEEIVVKSLGEALKEIRGIAGGAILGDGKVGLILDVEALLDMSTSTLDAAK